MTAAMGPGVPSFSSPTSAVAAAAARNWINPRSEDAAPAISANGDTEVGDMIAAAMEKVGYGTLGENKLQR